MLKYDHQLTEVKSRFPNANRILIVLSQNLTMDVLAAGLSLYLSLKSAGKQVDIVSTGTPTVGQSNLYGIGEIKNDVSKAGAGNFIISLDGVVDNTGTMQQVPALEKLDWYPEGSKLNLVFHVIPGQRFEPTNIASRHEQSGYDLTWVIGCQSLNELGNLFISNSQYFAQSQVINVDNNPLNAYFGFANVIDPQASSLSEIIAQVLPSLTLSMDRDIASNMISGIYSSTNNLTQKINPDTFTVISQAVQVGGTLPASQMQPVAPVQTTDIKTDYQPQIDQSISQPQFQPTPAPVSTQPQATEFTQTPPPMNTPSLQGSPFIVPPQEISIPVSPITPPSDYQTQPQINSVQPNAPQFQFNQQPQNSAPQVQPVAEIPQSGSSGFDLRQIFQIPQMPTGAQPANPQPVNNSVPQNQAQPAVAQASAEERPIGEQAYSPSPEMESPTPDWLVPKIFKGGNLG